MKKSIIIPILAVLMQAATTVRAQNWPDEYMGLPGDNLNLYAVMKLFQESETLEGFERSLNDENSRINNLDLNGDNLVDYIAVFDYVDGDVHTIVLRAVLNPNEYQDVAIFTVERFRNGSVQIQLIGDEALYGKNYIIEPIYDETPNPGYIGTVNNRSHVTVVTTTYYEVAAWPLIRFIYLPDYIVWHSAWYWGYYPVYWRPWSPFYWHFYYGYHYNWYTHYYKYYRHWNQCRYVRYNDFYYSRIRIFSPVVVININKGNYKLTYSRPEQRRAGEALYSRLQASQIIETQNSAADNNQARRSAVSQSTPVGATAGTGSNTERRTVAAASSRPANNNNIGQNTGTIRRSSTAVSNGNEAGTSAGKNTEATRRTSTTVTERPAPEPSSGQNPQTSRRSNSSVTVRTAASPSSVQSPQTPKRSSSTVTERTAVSSSPVQTQTSTRSSSSVASARTASSTTAVQRSGNANTSSRQSAPAAASSEQKRSSNGRSTADVQKSSNTGGSGNSKSSRR